MGMVVVGVVLDVCVSLCVCVPFFLFIPQNILACGGAYALKHKNTHKRLHASELTNIWAPTPE